MGVKPMLLEKTVTTAGTEVPLVTSALYAVSVYIEAKVGNTGYIYVGDSSVTSTLHTTRLSAGAGFSFGSSGDGRGIGGEINIASIYIDSSVNGEGVNVTYFVRSGSN